MRIPVGVSTRVQRITRVRAARRGTRARVLQDDALLRPGWYLRSGETVWRHWRAPLPEHLRLSKGETRQTPARSNAPRALRIVSSTLQRAFPPVTFRSRRGSGTYPIAVAADDGGLVLLDPARGRVARTYGARSIDPEYVELRRRFERHLPTPAFEVVDDGRLLVEEFVEGSHFAGLDGPDQASVVRGVFRRYASLAAHEGEGDSRGSVSAALAAVRAGQLPDEVHDLLGSPELVSMSGRWPLVPSATDASVKNLIITSSGSATPIDLGNIRLDPFFYYPVGLVTMARGEVLTQYSAGRMDDAVGTLFSAVGCPYPLDERSRSVLLALRSALTSHREATASGTFDQAAFDCAMARRWSLLWSGRPASFT